jgi:hypothetical protein
MSRRKIGPSSPRGSAAVRAVPNAIGDNLRWSVHWRKDNGRLQEVDFGNDLTRAALRYVKAKRAKKPFATLRCRNSGFPPPEKYQPHYVWKPVKKKVKRKGKVVTKTVRERVLKTPMVTLNRKGIIWCPYCREMRKVSYAGQDYPALECHICGTTHRDFHMRRWNPLANRLYLEGYGHDGRRRRRRRAA